MASFPWNSVFFLFFEFEFGFGFGFGSGSGSGSGSGLGSGSGSGWGSGWGTGGSRKCFKKVQRVFFKERYNTRVAALAMPDTLLPYACLPGSPDKTESSDL